MQRVICAGVSGTGWPVRRTPRACAGMSPGGEEHRVVGVHERSARRHRAASASSAARSTAPVALPRPQALLQQPQPHDVAQEADRAVDAQLVGEVGRAALLGEDRRVQLHARPATRCRRRRRRTGRRGRGRRPRPRPCRASRRRSPAPAPRSRPDLRRAAAPERLPGGRSGGNSAGRDRGVSTVRRPVPRRGVEQAGRGRVGHLGPGHAGQPVRRSGPGSAAQARCAERPPRAGVSW